MNALRAKLKKKVIEAGLLSKDSRRAGDFSGDIFRILNPIDESDPVWLQIDCDIECEYKFYDALAMWLEQSFSEQVLLRLEVLAVKYIGEIAIKESEKRVLPGDVKHEGRASAFLHFM